MDGNFLFYQTALQTKSRDITVPVSIVSLCITLNTGLEFEPTPLLAPITIGLVIVLPMAPCRQAQQARRRGCG